MVGRSAEYAAGATGRAKAFPADSSPRSRRTTYSLTRATWRACACADGRGALRRGFLSAFVGGIYSWV